MEKFTIGLIMGAVGGALVVTNSYRMRALVKKSQDDIMAKIDAIVDEKLEAAQEPEESSTAKKKA
ncbi:MAG: hypothetical protein IJX98_06495 [Clostridia bacterium]|nr:hypothetical protein [Clostridia bacterium]